MKQTLDKRMQYMSIRLLLLASIFFSFTGLLARVAEQMGPFTQAAFRAGIMSVLFLAIGLYTKSLRNIDKKDMPLLIGRGIFIIADFSCFSYAVFHLPLGTTLFLFYASFIAVSFIYGSIIQHEKVDMIKLISVILAALGLYVIYQDGLVDISLLPALAAMCSGALFGLTNATIKNLADKYSPSQINFMTFSIATVLAFPVLFFTSEHIRFNYSVQSWLAIFIFSLVLTIANYATVIGFTHLETQKASLILLAEIIFTILVGWIFYNEVPTVFTAVGGLFITFALALPNIPFILKNLHYLK